MFNSRPAWARYFLHSVGALLFIFSLLGEVPSVRGAEGGGDIGVSLLDPLTMNVKEAKAFCEEEPHAFKCEVLKVRLKKMKGKKEISRTSYKILNANME